MPGEMTKGAGLALPEISKRQCLNALIIFTKTGHLFSINEPSKVIYSAFCRRKNRWRFLPNITEV